MTEDHMDYTEQNEVPAIPSFFTRVGMVFFSPGNLFQALAKRPVWFPMAAFGGLVAGAAMLLIPAEAWTEMFSGAGPDGQQVEIPAFLSDFMVYFSALLGFVGSIVYVLFASLMTYVVFVFIRRDNATFSQHLAINSHVAIIGALANWVMVWPRMQSLDPQRSIRVGIFFGFLPEGYLRNVLESLDIFQLWMAVVAGLGLSLLDPRRRWGPTAAILVGITVGFALLTGLFG